MKPLRGSEVPADAPLPEDAAIQAAHPLRTGRHDLYAEAMRLVGARHSKAGLVELVNWLLAEREGSHDHDNGVHQFTTEEKIAILEVERDRAERERDRAECERDRLLNWLVIVAALKGVDDIFRLVDNYLEPESYAE